jgi:hypothetical protein
MERRNFSVKDYDRANYFKYLAQEQENFDRSQSEAKTMAQLEKEVKKVRV